MNVKLTAFPAKNGESILLEFIGDKKTNILIDMGYKDTYRNHIKPKFQEMVKNKEKIDLLVLTHYDTDHIEGVIPFLEDLKEEEFINIDEIWINDYLTLCADDFIQINLNNEENIIYDFSNYALKGYRNGSPTITSNEISMEEFMTITKLIKELGYRDKINKRFNKMSIYRTINNEVIDINEEVNIRIIGPEVDNLKLLLKEFIKWFEKYKNLYSYIGEEELFELFISNYEDNVRNDIKELIGKKEIACIENYEEEIKQILKDDNKFSNTSLSNKSSIVFEIEFHDIKLMFTGDIDSQTLINSMNNSQRKYDIVKVSHHGSKYNTNSTMLDLIECDNYLICTDGSGKSKHPNFETLTYIASKKNKNIYLNYPLNKITINVEKIDALKKMYNSNLYVQQNKCMEIAIDNGVVTWKNVNC